MRMMRNNLARVSRMFAPALLASSLVAALGQSGEMTPKIVRGEVTDTICVKSGSHDQMMAKMPMMGSDKATCTRRCAEMGGKYVLYDEVNKKIYNLDDQARVSTFAGQRVRIAGIVERSNIRVRDVEAIG
jgi:hypothetical protein